MNYQARHDTNAVIRLSDNAIIGPEDTEDWAEYQSWLSEGNTVLPPDPLPKSVPQEVPMWAAKVILKRNNLFDQVTTMINSSDDDALKAVWEDGNIIKRNSAAIAAIASQLNLTEDQIDDMFIDANTLNV